MDHLEPNPDSCTGFVPNPFKKEKCKNCGHPWNLHLGVISQELISQYGEVKRAEKIAKETKAAAAASTATAKKAAAKQKPKTAEDEWFFDKDDEITKDDVDDDDDDALEFRMFTAEDVKAAVEALDRKPEAKPQVKPLKVKNLINFEECDVVDTAEDRRRSVTPISMNFNEGGATSSSAPLGSARLLHAATVTGLGTSPRLGKQAVVCGHSEEVLLEEMQHLRQMLADAQEEKLIQVAIVRDEVADKQAVIEDLLRQRAEWEALKRDHSAAESAKTAKEAQALSERLRQIEQQRDKAVDELRLSRESFTKDLAQASSQKAVEQAELEVLRCEVERLQAFAASAAGVPKSLAAVFDELYQLCIHTRESLGDSLSSKAPELTSAGSSVEAELMRFKEALQALHVSAKQSSSEKRNLLTKLQQLEQLLAQERLAKQAVPAAVAPATPRMASRQSSAAMLPMTPCSTANTVTSDRAAQTLKEIRLHAEQQLAWIQRRLSERKVQAAASVDRKVV